LKTKSNVAGESINSNMEITKGQFIMMRDLFKVNKTNKNVDKF